MKKKIILALVIVFFGYLFLPTLIHKLYKLNTNDNDILKNRDLYNSIAIDINANKNSNNTKKKNSLDSLYLWFHIRGLAIDEDHTPKSTSEDWNEILQYWNE